MEQLIGVVFTGKFYILLDDFSSADRPFGNKEAN